MPLADVILLLAKMCMEFFRQETKEAKFLYLKTDKKQR
jgi:hypothetical protein